MYSNNCQKFNDTKKILIIYSQVLYLLIYRGLVIYNIQLYQVNCNNDFIFVVYKSHVVKDWFIYNTKISTYLAERLKKKT